MPPKILTILFINLFAIKVAFSQALYGPAPNYGYSPTAVPSVQTYPSNLSPSSTLLTAVPATLTSVPTSSSPTTLVSSPSCLPASTLPSRNMLASSVPASPSTEAKAYFLPGPIPDPKVTILSDMPSVMDAKPRIITDRNIIELNRASDPNFIEVIGKFCDPNNTNLQGNGNKPVLPALKENTVPPVKRLTMACSDNEPFLPIESLSYPQNQQVVCPGISKIDFVLVKPAGEAQMNNPIDYEGLLDGFFTYLEI